MTREREDELMRERHNLRVRRRQLIQAIVDARMEGRQDIDAIEELAVLAQREIERTRPHFEDAA